MSMNMFLLTFELNINALATTAVNTAAIMKTAIVDSENIWDEKDVGACMLVSSILIDTTHSGMNVVRGVVCIECLISANKTQ